MELDVLSGGDVAPAPAVVVDDVGQQVQLVGGDGAVRDLHPDHLIGAALTLAVYAVVEAKDTEDIFLDASGLVVGQHLLKLGDVGQQVDSHVGIDAGDGLEGTGFFDEVHRGFLLWAVGRGISVAAGSAGQVVDEVLEFGVDRDLGTR